MWLLLLSVQVIRSLQSFIICWRRKKHGTLGCNLQWPVCVENRLLLLVYTFDILRSCWSGRPTKLQETCWKINFTEWRWTKGQRNTMSKHATLTQIIELAFRDIRHLVGASVQRDTETLWRKGGHELKSWNTMRTLTLGCTLWWGRSPRSNAAAIGPVFPASRNSWKISSWS